MKMDVKIDGALVELQYSGAIDEVVSKYSADAKEFLRLSKPYQ